MYESLCSAENLKLAFYKARKGKTQKPYVLEFERNLPDNLLNLRTELLLQTYQPLPLKKFVLRDPKTRKISKSAFRDRIVHHAICNIIEPIFEKKFIHDSFANRIGKGTLNAVKRFDVFKRKISKNNSRTCYVLKADIKKYFDNVDHKILMQILGKIIQDQDILRLIEKILANHHSINANKGMPLGNLTSQFFANVYLNELDQFVKQNLKAQYYIRYVDDFVILHTSPEILREYQLSIDTFLKEKLELTLHPDKSYIRKLDHGIHFLGFRVFYHHKLLVKKNIRKFEGKLKQLRNLNHNDKVSREKIIEKFEGWLTYATNADTFKQRREMTRRFNSLFPTQSETLITSVKKHENFSKKIEVSNLDYSSQKTLHLFLQGKSVSQIAQLRQIKDGTVWSHLADLVEHHQLKLKKVLPNVKIKRILTNIISPDDTLKQIKERLNDDAVTFNEINCVLANVRGKNKKKSLTYFVNWYQRTNCFRKCYFNKGQRLTCRVKFQQLIAKGSELCFTKEEFLDFFNNNVNICVLPDKEKRRFMSWQEFNKSKNSRRIG